jgi:hypothetical protein
MRYACEYEGHNKLLSEAHVIVITITNPFYEKRKVSLCAEHANQLFSWLDFSWAKSEVKS